jgi:SAM-dependent methyltransferase
MDYDSNTMCRPCAVCGEARPESFKVWYDGFVKLYRCLACGFVSQFPGPGKFTIVTDYQDSYTLSFLNNGQEFMYPKRRCVLQDIASRIAAVKKGGDILDVGCGDGHFLYLCSQMGFCCSGVEDSKALSTYASQKAGAQVLQGLYAKDMFPAESFDVITLIQVLEHIPNPIDALETAYYHLRPNGILVIEVPSIRSPHFLAYRLTGIKEFVKPPRGVVYCHFGYFAPKSLTTLTAKCGFKEISVVTGRWQYKYPGYLKPLGKVLDPLLNAVRVGGILYMGAKR